MFGGRDDDDDGCLSIDRATGVMSKTAPSVFYSLNAKRVQCIILTCTYIHTAIASAAISMLYWRNDHMLSNTRTHVAD